MRKQYLPSVLSVALLGTWSGCGKAQPVAFDPAKNPPSSVTYLRLANQVDGSLKNNLLASWFPRCVDLQHGGFSSNWNEDWSPGAENDKFLVFQGRMTWVAAQVAMNYPDMAQEYLDYTRHGLAFLKDHQWDQQDGGFFWRITEKGDISDQNGDSKHVYGQSFGMYGAAAAYEATKDPAALDLAKRSFAWIEQHAHDKVNGGYYEALTRTGDVVPPPAGGTTGSDVIGTEYGYKSMNTHIHLLESLTELYKVWPDPLVRTRLDETFHIVRDKVYTDPGCLNMFFKPDWTPVPDHDSFGHDIETAYLLQEGAEALGMPNDPQTRMAERKLVDHALDWGFDDKLGGFYDKGSAYSAAFGLDKVWWTEAEGLNALLLMHMQYGSETPKYWNAFLKQWSWVWNYQTDHLYGGWYGTVTAAGAAPWQTKGDYWTECYHNGRALMNVERNLRGLAAAK